MKWFFAFIGYMVFRFPGAIIGFLLGSFFQSISKATFQTNFQRIQINPIDFELKLLALAGLVIKADKKVSPKELDFVRRYFVATYGKDRANEVFRVFNKELNKQDVSAVQLCQFFTQNTRYESRLQLLHFLFGIAKADGTVSNAELLTLRQFSVYLRISSPDFESIKAMFIQQVGSSYKILEVDRNASDAEIKKAYRSLAKKHHPDKVQHLGEAYVKAAREKFQNIQKAYESIKQERGF